MNKKHFVLSIILFAIVILASAGYLLWYGLNTSSENGETTNSQRVMTQEEAIRQAENYEPWENLSCKEMRAVAVHTESGAEYIFPSTCLPPGWKPKYNQETF